MAKEASLIVSSFKISSILLRLRKRKPSRSCLCFFVMKLPIKSVKLVVKLVVWTSSELPSSNLIEIDVFDSSHPSHSSQQTLSRFSADSQQILSRFSADSH